MDTTRREFCIHSCQVVSLAAIGPASQACGGASPTSPSSQVPALPTITCTPSGGVLLVTIDAASPLSSTGSAALVRSSAGDFLVSRSGQNTFVALTAIC